MEAAHRSLKAAEEAVEWSYQLQSLVLLGVAEGIIIIKVVANVFLD